MILLQNWRSLFSAPKMQLSDFRQNNQVFSRLLFSVPLN